jgi:ATP-dependent Zn protease
MNNINFTDVLINWGPMILLIGAWFVIMNRMQSGKLSKNQQDTYDLAKRQAEALERIAAALEKKV